MLFDRMIMLLLFFHSHDCFLLEFDKLNSNEELFTLKDQPVIYSLATSKIKCLVRCKITDDCRSIIYDDAYLICKLFKIRQLGVQSQFNNTYYAYNKKTNFQNTALTLKIHSDVITSLIELENRSIISSSLDRTI